MALTPHQNVLLQGNPQVGQIASYYFKLIITFFNLNSFLGTLCVNFGNLSMKAVFFFISNLPINFYLYILLCNFYL